MSAIESPLVGERDEADSELESAAEVDMPDSDESPARGRRHIRWSRVIAYGLLPALAMSLASAAGFLKWRDAAVRDAMVARVESVQAATDGTVALLSYRPDTVQKDLEAARGRLTGTFLNAYTQLTHDVVIPGSKQKQISAVATVPGAASVSAATEPRRRPALREPGHHRRPGRAHQHRVQRSRHPRKDRRALADLAIRPGVS